MARDDDPEARIRDLERSLGDRAHATPPGQGRGPTRMMLIVGAALAVVAIAIAVGLVTFFTQRSSSDASRPSEPSALTTQSELSTSTASARTTTASERSIETQNPAEPTPGGLLVISKSGTFACNDRETIVTGVSLDVVITGHCASLRVTTQDTTVTVDSADTINIAGTHNEVVFHSGTPSTGTIGNGNVIHQG